jgi:hypothetical protein
MVGINTHSIRQHAAVDCLDKDVRAHDEGKSNSSWSLCHFLSGFLCVFTEDPNAESCRKVMINCIRIPPDFIAKSISIPSRVRLCNDETSAVKCVALRNAKVHLAVVWIHRERKRAEISR